MDRKDVQLNRCIMVFPRFSNLDKIQEIRRRYDPLYEHVAPHVTLVFPFQSSISTQELERHVRNSVKGINPFDMTLNGISMEAGHFLFLNVAEGIPSIVEIHRRLYTGILAGYVPDFLKSFSYMPHLTVGRFADYKQLAEAFEACRDFQDVFTETVSEIAVEIIDEQENSEIEMTVKLV